MLISAPNLFHSLHDPALKIIDARFSLADPAQGRRDYLARHLPGAQYVDLDADLSGPKSDPRLGRHPLPGAAQFSASLARLGIAPESRVVVYDQSDGAMAACRFWFLLRMAGHRNVSVLDGGLAHWSASGFPLTASESATIPAYYPVRFKENLLVNAVDLPSLMAGTDAVLLDARAAERFRGDVEPLDKKAGHIPGAISRPYALNCENGRFKSPERLREEFAPLVQDRKHIVLSCGSGVTACHNLLALQLAGFDGIRLFAPGWSGWLADDGNPVATGP
jgi:thiosulfate/3-mercaptopyruvate sulfurtransferase